MRDRLDDPWIVDDSWILVVALKCQRIGANAFS